MSLSRLAKYFRHMAATDPNGCQQELWVNLADELERYLGGHDDTTLPGLS